MCMFVASLRKSNVQLNEYLRMSWYFRVSEAEEQGAAD